MNEELQNTLSEVITKATQAAERGTEFLAGEIPEVIQQLLMWHTTEYLILGTVWFIAAIICASASRWGYKEVGDDKNCQSDQDCGAVVCIFGCLFFVISCIPMIYCYTRALKIILAPKLYLLEYAAQLVK